eukprot:6185433-Alexandrium_andersonii.AAC.1
MANPRETKLLVSAWVCPGTSVALSGCGCSPPSGVRIEEEPRIASPTFRPALCSTSLRAPGPVV